MVTAAPAVATAAPRAARSARAGRRPPVHAGAAGGGRRTCARRSGSTAWWRRSAIAPRTAGAAGRTRPRGRVYRDFSLYVIRPDRRVLGPLELDGGEDPATEVAGDAGGPRRAGLSRRLPAVRGAGGGRVAGAAAAARRSTERQTVRAVSAQAGAAIGHAGRARRPASATRGPLTTPIVQSATFVFESVGGDAPLPRGRRGPVPLHALREPHPARAGGATWPPWRRARRRSVFASGMAAATTGILSLLEPGDEVLASASLYGGTTRFVREMLPRFGFRSRVVPGRRPRAGRARWPATAPGARGREPDQPHGGDRGPRGGGRRRPRPRDRGVGGQHLRHPGAAAPLGLGADLVMHSLTKALGGHSDIIGGALVGSRARIEKAHAPAEGARAAAWTRTPRSSSCAG